MSVLNLVTSEANDGEAIICEVSSHLMTEPKVAKVLLKLKHAPRVSMTFDNKILKDGHWFNGRCEATAFPSLVTYAWYLDGQHLVDQEGQEISLLVTRNHDNKKVECRVTNDVGTSSASTVIHIKCGLIRKSAKTTIIFLFRWSNYEDTASKSESERGNLRKTVVRSGR